jgi:hypothetical protein
MCRTVDHDRLFRTKWAPGSGRTFDLLYRALQEHGEHGHTWFLTATHEEARRLHEDVLLIAADLGLSVGSVQRISGRYEIGDSPFRVISASAEPYRGCRGHFVLDHRISERMGFKEYRDLTNMLRHAESVWRFSDAVQSADRLSREF